MSKIYFYETNKVNEYMKEDPTEGLIVVDHKQNITNEINGRPGWIFW